MKSLVITAVLACSFLSTFAQYEDVISGYNHPKSRQRVNEKMNELLKRVQFEADCDIKELDYLIVDKYKQYTSAKRESKNPPKTVLVKACGKKFTYILVATDGNFYNWLEGTWVLNSSSE